MIAASQSRVPANGLAATVATGELRRGGILKVRYTCGVEPRLWVGVVAPESGNAM
jgi:hypothetical protein